MSSCLNYQGEITVQSDRCRYEADAIISDYTYVVRGCGSPYISPRVDGRDLDGVVFACFFGRIVMVSYASSVGLLTPIIHTCSVFLYILCIIDTKRPSWKGRWSSQCKPRCSSERNAKFPRYCYVLFIIPSPVLLDVEIARSYDLSYRVHNLTSCACLVLLLLLLPAL
jgi:hypothetical protein